MLTSLDTLVIHPYASAQHPSFVLTYFVWQIDQKGDIGNRAEIHEVQDDFRLRPCDIDAFEIGCVLGTGR